MVSYPMKALYVLARTGAAVCLVAMGAAGIFGDGDLQASTSLWSYLELGAGLAIMLANLFLLNDLAAESLVSTGIPVAGPWTAGVRPPRRLAWSGTLSLSGTVVPLRSGALGR